MDASFSLSPVPAYRLKRRLRQHDTDNTTKGYCCRTRVRGDIPTVDVGRGQFLSGR